MYYGKTRNCYDFRSPRYVCFISAVWKLQNKVHEFAGVGFFPIENIRFEEKVYQVYAINIYDILDDNWIWNTTE